MAYQDGIIRFKGTDISISYYKMKGEYHVRQKSMVDAKMFWKDPRFANSRNSCKRFGEGNKLASAVYRSLPKQKQQYQLFCYLKSLAITFIRKGIATEEIIQLLKIRAQQHRPLVTKQMFAKKKKPFPYAIEVTPNYIAISFRRFVQLEKKYGEEKLLAMAASAISISQIQGAPQVQQLKRA